MSGYSIFLDKAGVTVDALSSTVQQRMGIKLFPIEDDSNFQLESRGFYISNRMWWYMENLGGLEMFNLARGTTGYKYISSVRCRYRREPAKDDTVVSPVSSMLRLQRALIVRLVLRGELVASI